MAIHGNPETRPISVHTDNPGRQLAPELGEHRLDRWIQGGGWFPVHLVTTYELSRRAKRPPREAEQVLLRELAALPGVPGADKQRVWEATDERQRRDDPRNLYNKSG
jgi:hypothetical protein